MPIALHNLLLVASVLLVAFATSSVICLHSNASSSLARNSVASSAAIRYRARVGRIFIAHVGEGGGSDEPAALPDWLHRRPDSDLVEGVPLNRHSGQRVRLPAADGGAIVEVLPRASASSFGNVSATGGCSRRPPTVATVLLDLDPETVGPQRLAALLRNMSAKLQVKISTLEISPDAPSSQQQQRQYLLASGPGNANTRRSLQAARVIWQVGCGSIDARHLRALERLERLAITGELTPEPVLLWYVADLIEPESTAAAMDAAGSLSSSRLRRSAYAYPKRRADASFLSVYASDQLSSAALIGSPGASAPASSMSSGLSSPPLPTGDTPARPPPPSDNLKPITLPTTTASTTVSSTTVTTTLKPATTEPGLRQIFQMSAEPYSFPVGVLTRIVLMPSRDTAADLKNLKTAVVGCGHNNELGVFGRYYPAQMVLEGHPTAKDIGSQHKCSLHVTDSRGKQDFFGFTIRVPEPAPPKPLPTANADNRLFSLLLGVRYNRQLDPAAYFANALEHDIRLCVTPLADRCVSFAPDSPLQFNAATCRVYGLAWRRNQLTQVRPVYLLATSKYNKTAILTAGYSVTEPRPEDAAHQNKINHQYQLHIEADIDYLRQLETHTKPLYDLTDQINSFLEGSSNSRPATGLLEDAPGLHLKWLNRTDTRSRSMVLVFGCIINYGLRYCPRMSIIDVAKKMFKYCGSTQPEGRPWPEFSNALAPSLTPVQLITTPLGTCTSGSYLFPMQFYMAPSSSCPNNKSSGDSTTPQPQPLAPPLWPLMPTAAPDGPTRSGLTVNYATSKEHGVYCLLPFSTSVGSGFQRPIKRPECVTDSSGRNLLSLPLQLCTSANDDGSDCVNEHRFISWNATIRGFEGIPFDADVGAKHFTVLVRNSDPASLAPPARFNLSVVVEQPQWGPFRFHRVRMSFEVDRWRVADLDRQYAFFRFLNDLLSTILPRNKIYMRLPPDNLRRQLELPTVNTLNLTLDWTVVAFDSDGAVIDGYGKYQVFCPVNQLLMLRRILDSELMKLLKRHAITLQSQAVLLEGNCSSYNFGDLHSFYMHTRQPINNIVTDYSFYPSGDGNSGGSVVGNGGSNGLPNGNNNGIDTASVGDSNVLLITVAPACGLVLLALLVALLVACCLYRRKPASNGGAHIQQQQQQQGSRSRHVSYQPQQQQQQPQQYHSSSMSRGGATADFSLTSKHVPIIFAEELEERPSAPTKPLILPNEKPPLPPPDLDGYDQDELIMERTPLNPQQQQQQQLMLMQMQHIQQQQQQFATLGRSNGHNINGGGGGGGGVGGVAYRTLPGNQQQQQQQQRHLQTGYADKFVLEYSNQG